MPVDTRLNGFGFGLKPLSRRIQAVIPNWHTPYSIDTGDLDRDGHVSTSSFDVVQADVNDDAYCAIQTAVQLLIWATITLG